MKKIFLKFLFLMFSVSAFSQVRNTDYSASAILNDLQKLPVFGKVLFVAAHPDDENTRLLAWLANEKHFRTGYLSLTRGDGGQNLIGDEQGIDLGLIRTQELLAARRIDGAEQFFSRAYDFGYSKSPQETMETWGHDKILSDVVWVIRKFQPDVIITRFPITGEGGHGHHTASAILAGEAFDAAADPNRFPEQLKEGVTTWQAKSLLWNTFNFGGNNTTREDQLKIDVGGYNAVLGKSYGEIAAQSRSQHKSQGFGVPAQRGESFEYFAKIKGADAGAYLMGNTAPWSNGLGETYNESVQEIIKGYDPYQPNKSVAALVNLYQYLQKSPQGYWRNQKLVDVAKLIEASSGLFMEAFTVSPYAVQGDSMGVSLSFINRMGIKVSDVSALGAGIQTNLVNTPNKLNTFNTKVYIPADAPSTQPYWLADAMAKGSFNVADQKNIGKAESDLPMINFTVNINGVPVEFAKPIRYKFTDPVAGEVYQPYAVVPQVEAQVSPSVNLSFNGKRHPAVVQYRLFTAGSNLDPQLQDYNSLKNLPEGGKYSTNFNYKNLKALPDGSLPLWDNMNHPYYSLHEIKYDHIPVVRYFSETAQKTTEVNFTIAEKRIGYIAGAGDKVPQSLSQMGYQVSMLNEADVTAVNLVKYDAVVTGVRAFNTVSWLPGVHDVLMEYVKQGGVLLVQYNTNNNLGPLKSSIGPYPFTISRNRVTDENAKVNFLLPSHPVLNYPNKITDKDFENWIQERSIYHATDIDSRYQRILKLADPGEEAQDGSLVVADYGKGRFIYTGLVFFRELPAGIPGAFRLIANLLASPVAKKP